MKIKNDSLLMPLNKIDKTVLSEFNLKLTWNYYIDTNDPKGIAFYDEDQLLGYPKNISQMIYMAYKNGFDECKNKQLNHYNDIIKKLQALSNQLNQTRESHNEEVKKSNPGNNLKSYIYFLHAGNYIKIGYSQDIHKRIKQLQTGSPFKLRLVLAIEGGVKLEKQLHKKFNKYRHQNEWFYYNLDIANFIESMKSKCLKLAKDT
jgi:hypothetical protein